MLTTVNWQEKLNESYKIVVLAVSDIFNDQKVHTYNDIIQKIKEYNLDLIPTNLIPSICLDYSKNELSLIATKSMDQAGSSLELFTLNYTKDFGVQLGYFDSLDNGQLKSSYQTYHHLLFARK